MKNPIKILLATTIMVLLVSCKEGNANGGSDSYKDNHPQDTTQTVKGDSARVE